MKIATVLLTSIASGIFIFSLFRLLPLRQSCAYPGRDRWSQAATCKDPREDSDSTTRSNDYGLTLALQGLGLALLAK